MACKRKKTEGLDDVQKQILEALTTMDEPAGCKVIAEATGLTVPKVNGKLRGLKNRGWVQSPIKGKYVITEEGRGQLK